MDPEQLGRTLDLLVGQMNNISQQLKENQANLAELRRTTTDRFDTLECVIGHVEGVEASVGVAQHSLHGIVSVDPAPSAAGLPHPIKNTAYHKRITSVLHSRDPCALLLRRAHAPDWPNRPMRHSPRSRRRRR
ncbi:hypothetical protein M5K25_006946 [Dendrobium thyrsiflorum]|uniref:Uncharacterized protein n=1 Tax=Dendrobium thyrsiflorum TaxID=117978 RepID=A0ABD0VJM5_DENTH